MEIIILVIILTVQITPLAAFLQDVILLAATPLEDIPEEVIPEEIIPQRVYPKVIIPEMIILDVSRVHHNSLADLF